MSAGNVTVTHVLASVNVLVMYESPTIVNIGIAGLVKMPGAMAMV